MSRIILRNKDTEKIRERAKKEHYSDIARSYAVHDTTMLKFMHRRHIKTVKKA